MTFGPKPKTNKAMLFAELVFISVFAFLTAKGILFISNTSASQENASENLTLLITSFIGTFVVYTIIRALVKTARKFFIVLLTIFILIASIFSTLGISGKSNLKSYLLNSIDNVVSVINTKDIPRKEKLTIINLALQNSEYINNMDSKDLYAHSDKIHDQIKILIQQANNHISNREDKVFLESISYGMFSFKWYLFLSIISLACMIGFLPKAKQHGYL